ncbi:hypothetical protein ACFRDV_24335 [Streptomyces fagopyri]|uniref:hypothetical protein n=1 Tax=Streptomyces fagopyri TaxID=2662397 RepID=UPI0036B6D342
MPGYAGRVHHYFTAHPERLRIMNWGRLEPVGAPLAGSDDPVRATTRRKTEQVRAARQAGHLDPSRDPADILMFVSQIAMTWVGRTDLVPADEGERVAFLTARRAAIVAAVQRLFPAVAVRTGR